MSVRTDVINLNVNINGNVAQNQLNDLRKKAADIALEMKGLKKGTQEYIDANKQLSKVEGEMTALKQSIGLTALTEKELVAEVKKLSALKGSVQPFTKEFKDLQTQLDAAKSRLYDVRNGVSGLSSVYARLSDTVKQFGVLAASYLGFQAIINGIKTLVTESAKLSDQLADLQRVAGLTADEATNLNKRLQGIDTRTSVSNLNDIAIIAGKLGVAKDQIYGFTKAVDELVVSLGDELGDADQITTQLGKILNVFDGKITADNITKLGNAFVELANTGAATGGFIADFDQRLSGIAKASGISLGALSGLGAGIEEMGGRVESSSSAIQKLVYSIADDIPKAAKIAGQSTEEFRKLFQFDPTEAILKYSQGLVKDQASFEAVTASLKEAGEEGVRTRETITKIGTSADYLRGRIDLGKKSIQESTASTEAFALKNQTLGAELDKIGKSFYSFVSSNAVTNFLKDALKNTIDFVKWIKDLPQWIDQNTGTFYTLVSAVVLYNAALIKSAIVTSALKVETIAIAVANKAAALTTTLVETAQAGYIVVTNLLTGKIKLATAAQRLWNIAMTGGASVIGIVVVAGLALYKILESIFSGFNKLAIQQKASLELGKEAVTVYGDQVNKLELLKRVLEDSNSGLDTKKQAYKELITLHPEFEKTLQLDITGHLQGASAIDEYIKSLKKKGEAEAAQNLSNQKNQEILQLQQERYQRSLKSDATILGGKGSVAFQYDIAKIDDKIKALQVAKDFFDKKIVAALGTNNQNSTTTTNTTTVAKEDPTVKARRASLQKLIDQSKVDYETLNATDKAGQLANLALREKYEKELDALDNKKEKSSSSGSSGNSGDSEHKKLLKEAQDFYKSLQQLKEDSANASKTDDEKELAALQQKYNELHAKALDYFKKNITDRKTYTAEEKLIVEAFNNDLAALQQKQFGAHSEEEYNRSLKDTQDYFDQQRHLESSRYTEGKQTKEQYDAEINALDIQQKNQEVMVAEDYSKTVKKAAEDVTKFKKEQLNQQDSDDRAATARAAQRAKDEVIAKARLDVIKAPNGSKQQQSAQKALVKAQFDQDTATMDRKSQVYLEREAELQAAMDQIDADYNQQRIQNWSEVGQQLVSITDNLFQMLNNLDERALKKEEKINDAKKANFKKQLDHKLISQKQYDAKVAAADAEMDKKKAELQVKEAKRQKAQQLFAAITNTASAVVGALGSPPVGPWNIALAALMGALGAVQIGVIASQPLPDVSSFGQGGLIENGPYHSDKSRGLPLINPETGQTEMLLEKDEGVVKGQAMRDRNKYTVTGTPSQIASKLNAIHGGVNWESGAQISLPKFRERPAQINPNLPRIMAQGGTFRPPSADNTAAYNDDRVVSMLGKVLAATERKSSNRSYVVLKDIESEAGKYNAARRASGLG